MDQARRRGKGTDHLAVDRVVQEPLHEAAVDLEEVHGEVLQVAERRQAGAEVVERELAAELLQRLDEAAGLREVRDGLSPVPASATPK
jgi:hypothetical protein